MGGVLIFRQGTSSLQLPVLPHPSSGEDILPNAPGDGRSEHLGFFPYLAPGLDTNPHCEIHVARD